MKFSVINSNMKRNIGDCVLSQTFVINTDISDFLSFRINGFQSLILDKLKSLADVSCLLSRHFVCYVTCRWLLPCYIDKRLEELLLTVDHSSGNIFLQSARCLSTVVPITKFHSHLAVKKIQIIAEIVTAM